MAFSERGTERDSAFLSFNDGSHLFSMEIIFSESLASLCSHAVCLPESLVENDLCLLKPDSL